VPAHLHLEGFDEPEILVRSSTSLLLRARGPEGPVLIQVYPAEAWTGSESQRLRQGTDRLEALEHPAIPRPLAREQGPEGLSLVFPDPGSWTLREHLQGQPMDPTEAAETVLQIAEALRVADRGGLAHGHLNPDTIRVTPETGRVFLLGLETGQPRPGEPVETAADLRALGEMLAFLLTAQEPPPEGPALRRACPDLSCDLEWIASRLRHSGTSQGYRSAGEAAGDLESWLGQDLSSPASRSVSPSPDLTSLWAEIEAGPSVQQEEPPRLRWLIPALLGLLAWLGWLVAPSWKTPEAGAPPDEVVYSAPGVQEEVTTQPGHGILALEVRGLRPPDTKVRLKIRDGDQVIREAELPAGQGLVEIPKGRLLTLEIAADLHSTRTRSVLLEPTRGRVTLKTVLIRHTEVTISTVPGALVHLDRLLVGQADEKGVLMLPPGTLEVGRVCLLSVSKVGYEAKEESFTVKTGHTVVLMDLAPLRAAGRPTRHENRSESPLLPSIPAPEASRPGPSPVSKTPPSRPERAPQAPPAARPSPATPQAPPFPQIPPAPTRSPSRPGEAPAQPPQPPGPGTAPAAPAPPPVSTSAPAPAPPPVSKPPPPSGGSALPVLLPDN